MGATKSQPNFDEWAVNFDSFYKSTSRAESEFLFTHHMVKGARRWLNLVDELLRDTDGQSRARWQTLAAIIFSDGPIATLDLSYRMAVQWPTLIRTLNELEKDGMIKREVDPNDRRSRLISATEEGVALFHQAQAALDPKRESVLSEFTKEELELGAKVLSRFVASLEMNKTFS